MRKPEYQLFEKNMKPKMKGNAFERKISNLLSERFKDVTGLEKAFRRNADSGSFFGGSNVRRTQTHDVDKANFGDIIAPANFAFSLECKHYKAPPSFAMMMKQDCKEWDKWIDQATQDAKSSNKKMAVIVKYNGIEEIVIMSESHGLHASIQYKDYFVVTLQQFLSLPDSLFFV